MENNELTTYIDAFLEGILSEEEKAQFINRIASDPELKLEVEAQKKLKATIQRNELKKKLVTFERHFIPDKTTLIDSYLSESLSEELLLYVKNKLVEDESFQSEVEAQQHIISSIKRRDLKEKLQNFENKRSVLQEGKKEEVKEVKFIPFSPKVISLAASVLIILFISVFFLTNPYQDVQVVSSYKVEVEHRNEGLGFAGDEKGNIDVEIIVDGEHTHHYDLSNKKLRIYFEEGKTVNNIKIVFDPTSIPSYMITLDDEQFYIDETEKIEILK